MKGDIAMLEFIKDRVDDFDVKFFVNELADASKSLGILEAKIDYIAKMMEKLNLLKK